MTNMKKEQFKESLAEAITTADSLEQMVHDAFILAISYSDLRLMEWKNDNLIKFQVREYLTREQQNLSTLDMEKIAKRKLVNDLFEYIEEDPHGIVEKKEWEDNQFNQAKIFELKLIAVRAKPNDQ